MSHIILVIVAALAMLPGIPLAFLPLPALVYMFLVAAGFGFADGFMHLTGGNLAVLAGIVLVSIIVDQLSGILGARYSGASAKSIGAGFLGTVIGTIVLPPLGGMLGLIIGVAISEYLQHQNHGRMVKAVAGSFLGMLTGKIINAALALLFLVTFVFMAV